MITVNEEWHWSFLPILDIKYNIFGEEIHKLRRNAIQRTRSSLCTQAKHTYTSITYVVFVTSRRELSLKRCVDSHRCTAAVCISIRLTNSTRAKRESQHKQAENQDRIYKSHKSRWSDHVSCSWTRLKISSPGDALFVRKSSLKVQPSCNHTWITLCVGFFKKVVSYWSIRRTEVITRVLSMCQWIIYDINLRFFHQNTSYMLWLL